MKQHLGARPKVGAHSQLVPPEKNLCTVLSDLTKQLSKQMMTIQQQLAMITANQTRHTHATKTRHLPATFVSKRPETRKPTMPARPTPANSKPGFCFRCGEDDHIRPQCNAQPNPTLVSAKRKQFQDKQQLWQNQKSTSQKHLN